MDWRKVYSDKIVSVQEAVSHIKSGDRLLSTSMSSVPYYLYEALYERRESLENVEISMGFAGKPFLPAENECKGHFIVNNIFFNAYERAANRSGGRTNLQVMHLSRFCDDRAYRHPGNVVMLAVSLPDSRGYVSTGYHSFDREVLENADLIIAQMNKNLPFLIGEGNKVSLDQVDFIVEHDEPLPCLPPSTGRPEHERIAAHIVDRIPDGACLQFGIGGIGNAVGLGCKDKKHLGIHTELFTESMIDLLECGAADNSMKNIDKGVTILGFALHTERMHRFLHENKSCRACNYTYTNEPYMIAKNDNFVSVNSCMQVDITGQVASEGVGFQQFSGTGGQVDFVRGAQMSKGGQSFLALESTRTDKEGKLHSKIVLGHEPGTPITTARTDVDCIATEYGVAELRYETIENRVKKLIAIAHPQFRDELYYEAKKLRLII